MHFMLRYQTHKWQIIWFDFLFHSFKERIKIYQLSSGIQRCVIIILLQLAELLCRLIFPPCEQWNSWEEDLLQKMLMQINNIFPCLLPFMSHAAEKNINIYREIVCFWTEMSLNISQSRNADEDLIIIYITIIHKI